MSLIKCPECGHEISNKATACVNCGHPVTESSARNSHLHAAWQTVSKARTPINVFSLAMMACSTILGMSAMGIDDICKLTAFKYTLHIFLAVSGMFFATILFCRKGMYHPEDIAKAKQAGLDKLGEDQPMIAAVFICLLIGFYGLYQLKTNETRNKFSLERIMATSCIAPTQNVERKSAANQTGTASNPQSQ